MHALVGSGKSQGIQQHANLRTLVFAPCWPFFVVRVCENFAF